MTTLLQIYESYHNGQKKQFVEQVQNYGASDFATDCAVDISDGVLDEREAFNMLVTFIKLNKKSARDILIDIANEFQNNYLTHQKYGDHNGLFDEHALALVQLAQKVRSVPNCHG